MAFQSAPGSAIAVMSFLLNGEIMQNSVHANIVTGYDLADLQLLADTVDANIAAAWLEDMTVDAAYVSTTVRGLEFENDQEASANAGAGPGLLLTQGLPGNVTLSIKRGSGFTGRSARGRLYWIGLAREQLQDNENFVSQTAADAIVANVQSMRGSIAGTVWTPAILSRFSNGLAREFAEAFEWLTSSVVDIAVDSQRSRLSR